MKIKNPYEAKVNLLEGANLVTELGVLTLDISKDRVQVFNEGVTAAQVATKPRRFSDELPADNQKILLFEKEDDHCTCVEFNKDRLDGGNTYGALCEDYWIEFTHWLPYPELS
jgi:hypothetical protein